MAISSTAATSISPAMPIAVNVAAFMIAKIGSSRPRWSVTLSTPAIPLIWSMMMSAWFGSIEVDPERLAEDVGGHQLRGGRALELVEEVRVRLLVVLELELLDVRREGRRPRAGPATSAFCASVAAVSLQFASLEMSVHR